MKLARKERRDPRAEGLIPLINVVFLMLLFFILAGDIAPPAAFKISPPVSISSTTAKPRSIVVAASVDGRYTVDGELVDLATLRSLLQARLAVQTQAGVMLKIDAALPAQRLLAVLQALRASPVERFTLLTRLARQ